MREARWDLCGITLGVAWQALTNCPDQLVRRALRLEALATSDAQAVFMAAADHLASDILGPRYPWHPLCLAPAIVGPFVAPKSRTDSLVHWNYHDPHVSGVGLASQVLRQLLGSRSVNGVLELMGLFLR